MALGKGKRFADKHDPNIKPDGSITSEILKHTQHAEISCDDAFQVAEILGVSANLVGMNADLIDVKLIKCELGLFGYRPRKNIVPPQTEVDPELKDAILDARINGKLPCKIAWEIASRLNIPKMTPFSVAFMECLKICCGLQDTSFRLRMFNTQFATGSLD